MRKMKKWIDTAGHRPGCPHKGIAVYGTDEEMAKYYSGYCPGCNVPVKWERANLERELPAPGGTSSGMISEMPR
jgi:hypothetical protein